MNPNNEVAVINSSIEIYKGASTLIVTAEEQAKILASFPENLIEIRPDGMIYLPQTFWRQRLNESFGIGQWCLVVKGSHKDPDENKDKLYLQGVLMVRGSFVAEAVGEAELHSDNPLQSWASVWESAKSDCITRCCKDLGIASELWQPQFGEKWKKENAVDVWVTLKNGKSKKQWRKKTAPPFYNENSGNKNASKNEDGQQADNNLPWLNVTTKEGAYTDTWLSIVKQVEAGTLTAEAIKSSYKISTSAKEHLNKLFTKKQKDFSPQQPPQPEASTESPKVPGAWIAKMEKCKTISDILEVYKKNKETIEAHRHIFEYVFDSALPLMERVPDTVAFYVAAKTIIENDEGYKERLSRQRNSILAKEKKENGQ